MQCSWNIHRLVSATFVRHGSSPAGLNLCYSSWASHVTTDCKRKDAPPIDGVGGDGRMGVFALCDRLSVLPKFCRALVQLLIATRFSFFLQFLDKAVNINNSPTLLARLRAIMVEKCNALNINHFEVLEGPSIAKENNAPVRRAGQLIFLPDSTSGDENPLRQQVTCRLSEGAERRVPCHLSFGPFELFSLNRTTFCLLLLRTRLPCSDIVIFSDAPEFQ